MSSPLFKKKGSEVWWCRIPNPDGGRHLRASTGHRDRAAALAEWRRLCRESVSGAHKAKNSPSLADALARRKDEREQAGRRHGTLDMYKKKGRHLVRLLGAETPIDKIEAAEIDDYVSARLKEGATSSSVHKELTVLRGTLRLARRRKEYPHTLDEVMPLDFSPKYRPKERVLSAREVDALIEVLPVKRGAVVALIVATGATYPSEVDPMREGDLDGNPVRLRGTKRETRDRLVPVPRHAEKWLELAKRSRPFERWTSIRRDLHVAAKLLSMCKPCREARIAWSRHEPGASKSAIVKDCEHCKAAPKFEPLSPNDLRRTFGHMLRAAGHPPHLIGAAMGHTDSRMAERVYAKLRPEDLAKLLLGGQPGASAPKKLKKRRKSA